MDEEKSPYEVLGVKPDASIDVIKKAYRELAHAFHPDKNSDKPERVRKLLEEDFLEIKVAYDQLCDPQIRRLIDEHFGFRQPTPTSPASSPTASPTAQKPSAAQPSPHANNSQSTQSRPATAPRSPQSGKSTAVATSSWAIGIAGIILILGVLFIVALSVVAIIMSPILASSGAPQRATLDFLRALATDDIQSAKQKSKFDDAAIERLRDYIQKQGTLTDAKFNETGRTGNTSNLEGTLKFSSGTQRVTAYLEEDWGWRVVKISIQP